MTRQQKIELLKKVRRGASIEESLPSITVDLLAGPRQRPDWFVSVSGAPSFEIKKEIEDFCPIVKAGEENDFVKRLQEKYPNYRVDLTCIGAEEFDLILEQLENEC